MQSDRPLHILVLGSAQFSDRSWVNCQHVARRLAEHHRVLFVDSIGLRRPRARGSDLRRIWARLRDAQRGIQRVSESLAVLSPAFEARVPALLHRSIRRALNRLDLRPDAVIVYLPTWVPVIEMLRRDRKGDALRVIYHCVDAYAANPGVDAEQIVRKEQQLLTSADVVLAVSEPLRERLAALHHDVRLFPNVADTELFERAAASASAGRTEADDTAIERVRALPAPRVLYLGNLAAYKVDLPLLERIAAARPSWSWILVGPEGRGDPGTNLTRLLELSQVHWLGELDSASAAACVAAVDVCLLPLRVSPSTESSAPLKIFEYLASGKPVVATPIPALAHLAEMGLVRTAAGDEDWLEKIEDALREGDRGRESRQAEARLHGWAERIREIEQVLLEPARF